MTLKQLEEADKRLWSVLAERTRSGIKVSPEGRPCDKVFVQCFESTEVMHYLQPMLSTTQDWPSARPTKRFRGHGDDEASDTKVKGKGRFFFFFATLVSPVTRDGRPHDGAEHRPGWAVRNAARRKRRQTYPEIDRSRRRWAEEAATFVRLLARARAAGAPAAVRNAAQAAWVLRWSGLISVAAQRALAATFLELPLQSELAAAGPPPALHELLADARWQQAPEPSRLPARA